MNCLACPSCRFNKREDDFTTKQDFDDYLEEREDISEQAHVLSLLHDALRAPGHSAEPCPLSGDAVFNMVEGIDIQDMERKVDEYRRLNADSIVRNEALRAEELRQRAAAAEEGAGHAGVSGTAAAFQEGADAEPHQGMEYTAALPEAAAAALTA